MMQYYIFHSDQNLIGFVPLKYFFISKIAVLIISQQADAQAARERPRLLRLQGLLAAEVPGAAQRQRAGARGAAQFAARAAGVAERASE